MRYPAEVYECSSRFFGLLGEPARLRLLEALSQGEGSVGDLLDATGLSQANGSRHLVLMYQAGWLTRRREGSQVFYRLSDALSELLFPLLHEQLRHAAAEWARRASVSVSTPSKEEASV